MSDRRAGVSKLDNAQIIEKINQLRKEKHAAILAHYYERLEVQEIADVVGDSHELARKASSLDCDVIVLCGVRFMAESAKILNPSKVVLHPAPDAGCPMADMLSPKDIRALKALYPDAAVVCYVNSTAETKVECDICCTSSNAVRVVSSLPNEQIIFVPDRNLGAHVAAQLPEKSFFFFDGGCPIHRHLTVEAVHKARRLHPEAMLAVHPECAPEVVAAADFVGSTSQILSYAESSESAAFIIGTEIGVVERLQKYMPNKHFYLLSPSLVCTNMKKVTLASVLHVLETGAFEVQMTETQMKLAYTPLARMIQV